MLLRAMRDLPVDRARSFLVGDKQSDLDAAAAAGLPGFLIAPNTGDLAAQVRAILGA